ncbi:MAG: glycosyltransferase family 4 protein [Deltaproteobacteria bacterium]|nr:glycosyltransferase family 4 protein [Deltaproteobacteria bacterium]
MDDPPIYISMPRGVNFGWGVCGIHLTLNLADLVRVTYITDPFTLEDIGDSSQYERLSSLWRPVDDLPACRDLSETRCLDHPVLQAIEGKTLRPLYMKVKAPRVIGYTFFETPFLDPDQVAWANDYYDVVAAGSTWCREVLENQGVRNTATVIQGVDPALFRHESRERTDHRDKFVVFSGGKLELRKGQDLVIRAFKVLQDRHEDVLLVNSWFNLWDASLMTMRFSPYITFYMPKGGYFHAVSRLMEVNGIDPQKVLTLPPLPHARMPEIYSNTDCGLFPNRCEGGTNLVLMEYMACGGAAIASMSSGHRDIITTDNSLPITTLKAFTMKDREGRVIEQWDDPSLEEIVEKLEWAYPWRKAAEEFHYLLTGDR